MQKSLIMAAAFAAGALAPNAGSAQYVVQHTAANEAMKATGMVTEADADSGEITVNDQTYVMPKKSAGAAMMPQVGAEITLYYEQRNGQKTITRIGQAE